MVRTSIRRFCDPDPVHFLAGHGYTFCCTSKYLQDRPQSKKHIQYLRLAPGTSSPTISCSNKGQTQKIDYLLAAADTAALSLALAHHARSLVDFFSNLQAF
jgi:hypothetical protein